MKGYPNTINVIQEWASNSQEFEERRNAFLNEKGEVQNHILLRLSSVCLACSYRKGTMSRGHPLRFSSFGIRGQRHIWGQIS